MISHLPQTILHPGRDHALQLHIHDLSPALPLPAPHDFFQLSCIMIKLYTVSIVMLVLAESRVSEPLGQAPQLQLTLMLSVACVFDD